MRRIFVLFLAIVGTHAWMLSLDFQVEDYLHVAEADRLAGPSALLGNDGDRHIFIRFFRPSVHFSLYVERRMFGVSSVAFHATNIVWHFGATVLFYLALRGTLRTLESTNDHAAAGADRHAFVAAVIFGLMPGKWGAVSWIAARGDLLAMFGLAAAWLGMITERRGSRWGIGLWIIGLPLAVFAKESGSILPFMIIVADALIFRRVGVKKSIRWIEWPLWTAIGASSFVLRKFLFGHDSDVYAGAQRTWSKEILRRMFDDLWPASLGTISGRFDVADGTTDAIVAKAFFFIVAAAVFLAGITSDRRTSRGVAAAIAYLFLIFLPLRFFREGGGVEVSRLFYLPAAAGACLLALPIDGHLSPHRLIRFAACGYVAVLIGGWFVLSFPEIRKHRESIEIMRDIRATIETCAAESPPNTRHIVVDLPGAHCRVPLFGRYLSAAFRPPFRSAAIDVESRLDVEIKDGAIFVAAVPQRFYFFDPAKRRLEPRGALQLPTEPSGLDAPLVAGAVDFPEPISVQSTGILRLELEKPTAGSWDFVLRLSNKGGEKFDLHVVWESSKAVDAIHLRPTEYPGGPILSLIDRAEVIAVPDAAPKFSRLASERSLPAIRLIGPTSFAEVDVESVVPAFVFDRVEGAKAYRLVVTHPIAWVHTIATESVEDVGGFPALTFSSPSKGGLPSPFRWESMKAADGSHLFDILGVRKIEIYWRIEALIGDENWAQAASETRVLIVTKR